LRRAVVIKTACASRREKGWLKGERKESLADKRSKGGGREGERGRRREETIRVGIQQCQEELEGRASINTDGGERVLVKVPKTPGSCEECVQWIKVALCTNPTAEKGIGGKKSAWLL